jgi:hypothetical protein
MTHFLIEVAQISDEEAYKQIDDAVHMTGSHFATHADWEHKDGVCTGSMTADLASRQAAFAIVPPNMRAQARITEIDARAAA